MAFRFDGLSSTGRWSRLRLTRARLSSSPRTRRTSNPVTTATPSSPATRAGRPCYRLRLVYAGDTDAPTNATAGDNVTADATVANPNDFNTTQTVEFRLGGQPLASESVTLDANESTDVTFTVDTTDIEPDTSPTASSRATTVRSPRSPSSLLSTRLKSRPKTRPRSRQRTRPKNRRRTKLRSHPRTRLKNHRERDRRATRKRNRGAASERD